MSPHTPRPDVDGDAAGARERWRRIEPLIDAALDRAAHERGPFLDAACLGDDALRAELDRLLATHNLPHLVLDSSAVERFASLFDGDAAPPPDVLGGRYRIDGEIGRGGMATVYRAHDIRHDRAVAVKVVHREVVATLGAERFLAEIRMTAHLQHPHILPLHDSGEVDGFLFYVMPYVEGESLRRRLERETRLPIDDAVRIATEVASGLDAAHRHGVIHRDIKPENILLQDGTALLADFGIALATGPDGAARRPNGLTFGTPQYMSPEQAAGASTIDGRTDVYALGTVVFEMIAGVVPFVGTSAAAVMAQRTTTPAPPLRGVRPDVPATVDAAVAQALARDPGGRFRTAGDFAAALGAPSERPGGRPLLWRTIAAGVVIAGAALWYAVSTRAPQRSLPGPASVAGAAGVTIVGTPPRHQPSLEALEQYRLGQHQLDVHVDPRGVQQAVVYFTLAIARDSQYADAYAGLAAADGILGTGNVSDVPAKTAFDKARAAALHAIALDSLLPEGHAALGFVRLLYDFDWTGAEAEFSRANTLDPFYRRSPIFPAVLYEWRGQFDEAVRESEAAVQSDPRSVSSRTELGRALFFAHRYPEALAQLDSARQLDSTFTRVHFSLGEIDLVERRFSDAIAEFRQFAAASPASAAPMAFLALAFAAKGDTTAASAELDSLRTRAGAGRAGALYVAIAYAALGRRDDAFRWLDRSATDHSIRPIIMDPTFDDLHRDPRFTDLMRRLGLRP